MLCPPLLPDIRENLGAFRIGQITPALADAYCTVSVLFRYSHSGASIQAGMDMRRCAAAEDTLPRKLVTHADLVAACGKAAKYFKPYQVQSILLLATRFVPVNSLTCVPALRLSGRFKQCLHCQTGESSPAAAVQLSLISPQQCSTWRTHMLCCSKLFTGRQQCTGTVQQVARISVLPCNGLYG